MLFDWDDVWPGHDALARLHDLHDLRPDFRATVFACPGLGDDDYWDSFPDWLELAVHGWTHSPLECAEWTLSDICRVIRDKSAGFVEGFKAPFWTISDDCYTGLAQAGWWVADHPDNHGRRPEGIRCNVVGGPDHWHGHIGNDCGNGIEETFDHVVRLAEEAESFEFMSECVSSWKRAVAA